MPQIKILTSPTTIGELKRVIAQYDDATPFGFKNQPMQELLEERYEDENILFISFQEPPINKKLNAKPHVGGSMGTRMWECVDCGWLGTHEARKERQDESWVTYICPHCSCESFYGDDVLVQILDVQ